MGNMKKRGESWYNIANERFKESVGWNKAETVDYMTSLKIETYWMALLQR